MRGFAICFLTRASVALLDSVLGFFTLPIANSPILRGRSSYPSRGGHDTDKEDACLFHSAQMSVQFRPAVLEGLLAGLRVNKQVAGMDLQQEN